MIISGPILALDLATHTGFCVGEPAVDMPEFGTFVLPSTGENVGKFISAFNIWLLAELERVRPELVIYEAPSLFAKTTPVTIAKLNGLASHAEFVCYDRRITCRQVNPSRLKKWFTGRGNATKDVTMAVARRHGFAVRDDNAADAVSVWAWGVYCFAPTHAGRFTMGQLGAGKLL